MSIQVNLKPGDRVHHSQFAKNIIFTVHSFDDKRIYFRYSNDILLVFPLSDWKYMKKITPLEDLFNDEI